MKVCALEPFSREQAEVFSGSIERQQAARSHSDCKSEVYVSVQVFPADLVSE